MVLSLMFIAFLLLGCTQVERDNPYDPDGINYNPDLVKKSSSSAEPTPSSSSSETLSSSSVTASSSSAVLSSSSSVVVSSSSAESSSSSALSSSSSFAVSSSSVELSSSSSVVVSSSSVEPFSSSALPSSSSVAASSSSVETCTANNNTSTHYCSEGTMKEYGSLSDSRDGQIYKTVIIGKQTWMAENLNYAASSSICYGDNTGSDSRGYCDTYGRLYDRPTALNACPSNWHLPGEREWEVLIEAVGGSEVAGKKLKAASGWKDNGNGTDDYGFSALPGGCYGEDGSFGDVGDTGYWWNTRTMSGNYYYNGSYSYFVFSGLCHMRSETDTFIYNISLINSLRSVRCIKD